MSGPACALPWGQNRPRRPGPDFPFDPIVLRAVELFPPRIRLGAVRLWCRRGGGLDVGGDDDERLAGTHEAEDAPRDALDVLIGAQVVADRLELGLVLLQAVDLLLEALFVAVETLREEGVAYGGEDEVTDRQRGQDGDGSGER